MNRVVPLLCLAGFFLNTTITVSGDHPLQRVLPLPEKSEISLPQHLELLRRLQALTHSGDLNSNSPPGNSQVDPAGSIASTPGRSGLLRRSDRNAPTPREKPSVPESQHKSQARGESEKDKFESPRNLRAPDSQPLPRQIQRLRNAFQGLMDRLPPGIVPPDLESIPPDDLQAALRKPETQQRMRALLEQFSQSGKLPEQGENSSTTSQPPLPLPPTIGDRPRSGKQPQPPISRQPGTDSKQFDSPSADANDSIASDRAMNSLRDFLNNLAGSSQPPRDSQPVPDSDTPQLPEHLQAIRDVLQHLQAASEQGPNSDGQTQSRSSAQSNESSPFTQPAEEQSIRIAEFLREQLRTLPESVPAEPSLSPGLNPPKSSSPSEQLLPSPSSAPSPASPRPAGGRTPAAGIAENSASPPGEQRRIASELEHRGLAQTLRQIIDEVREEERERVTRSTPNAAPRMENPATAELSSPPATVSEARPATESENSPSSSSNSSPFRVPADPEQFQRSGPAENRLSRRAGERAGNSALRWLRDNASQLLRSAGRETAEMSSEASGSLPGNSGTGSGFSEALDLTPVYVLAVLLITVFLIFTVTKFLKVHPDADEIRASFSTPITPEQIHSRADVIRAFHQFALSSTRSVQTWWTHRAVADLIISIRPGHELAVRDLTQVYEQARYLPNEADLSADQLRLARTALRECTSN